MSLADAMDALRWWGVLQLLGLAVFPLAALVLRALPDRGWTVAKPLGALLVAWSVWLVGCTIGTDFTRSANALAFAVMAALSAYAMLRRDAVHGRELLEFVRTRRRGLLLAEAVFALAFVAWAVVRSQDATLAEGEKFMDLGLFNSFVLNHELPPEDLFLRGETVNYYYFGYAIWGAVCQLSGVESSVGYNLTNVSLFALTVLGAFGLAKNLAVMSGGRRPWIAGVAAAFLAAVSGNLASVREVIFEGRIPATFDWWATSRVVYDDMDGRTVSTINEFPAFSFLLGEVHPHVMSLPVVLLLLSALVALVARGRGGWLWRSRPEGPLLMGLVALLLGALSALNTWDVVAYGALTALALATATSQGRSWGRRIVGLGVHLAMIGVLGLLAFLPFHLAFRPFAGPTPPGYEGDLAEVPLVGALLKAVIDTVSINTFEKSAGGFLLMFGGLLAVISSMLAVRLAATWSARDRWLAGGAALAAALAVLAVPLSFPLLAILPSFALLASWLALRSAARPMAERAALALVALGALLSLGVEVVYLDDGTAQRRDTLFKVYYEVWLMWSLAAGYGVWVLLGAVARATAQWRRRLSAVALAVGLSALVVSGSMYLVYAIPARDGLDLAFWEPDRPRVTQQQNGGDPQIEYAKGSLDGLEYLRKKYPEDLAAIRWLRSRPPGEGVVEGPGFDYTLHGRVVASSGQPGIVVWPNHESFWRKRQPKLLAEIEEREADLATLWQTLDPKQAEAVLRKYDIRYVFLGHREKEEILISQDAMAKFASFMRVVFRSSGSQDILDGTTIFELP